MSNTLPDEKMLRALELFRAGRSIREVATELRIAKETAHRIRKALVEIIAELGDEPLPTPRKN